MPRTFTPAKQDPDHTMKAVVYKDYGPSDSLKMTTEFPRPLRRRNHLLVKIASSTVNPVDVKLRRFPSWNMVIPKPKIPGSDIAGTVVEAPEGSKFKPGDQVMSFMPLLGTPWGAAAEYVSVLPEVAVKAPVREGCTLEQCAVFPLVGSTVVQGLAPVCKAWNNQTQGKKVLVQAGSGGVGTFAIQYCKNVLGMHVATTCSGANAELVKGLGADVVIDYKQQDFADVVKDFDCVIDPMAYQNEEKTLNSGVLKAHGAHYVHIASSDMKLSPGDQGTDRTLGAAIPEARLGNLVSLGYKSMRSWFSGIKFHFVFVHPEQSSLQAVADAVANGHVKPVIDKEYSLDQLAEAHDYVGEGHCHGKVLIRHDAFVASCAEAAQQ
eukprot:TRINITY_DN10500_c0_g1_i2.p2 TRINITY_DN10500_c0_g1~~TRINITY_DN10500_c0_g1_i2.p2  ORF type:complete len:379 (+),score=81.43 TRINITY_DN10500_c0_g1_i2:1552-2688(+)